MHKYMQLHIDAYKFRCKYYEIQSLTFLIFTFGIRSYVFWKAFKNGSDSEGSI